MDDLMFSKKVVQSDVDELFTYFRKTRLHRNRKIVFWVLFVTILTNRDHTSNLAIVLKNAVIKTELNDYKDIWSDDMRGSF